MKTIKITEEKGFKVDVTFNVMLKLYKQSGITEFKELVNWSNNPHNFGLLMSCVSVNGLKEKECIELLNEANSIKPIHEIINMLAEHINAFYTLDNKEGESVPNG